MRAIRFKVCIFFNISFALTANHIPKFIELSEVYSVKGFAYDYPARGRAHCRYRSPLEQPSSPLPPAADTDRRVSSYRRSRGARFGGK